MRFSNSGSSASGVTSRPVKPVPPVVMTTSMFLSLIHFFTCARIALTSSVTIARAASLWPAVSMRSPSNAPDLSSCERARVGNRQHRDRQRHEELGLVETGHTIS